MNRTAEEQRAAILKAASECRCEIPSLTRGRTCLDVLHMPGVVPCCGCCAKALAAMIGEAPAFPPEVMEAARLALGEAEKEGGDPFVIADNALIVVRYVARAVLSRAPVCPHALTTSRLADGELAPDERAAAREHVAGCVECQGTVGDALQLAALAHDPPH